MQEPFTQESVKYMDSKKLENSLRVSYGRLPYGADPEPILLASADMLGNKKPQLIGTAFPFLYANWVGIVTAAHTINNLSGNPIIAVNGPKKLLIQNAQIVFFNEIDVAIIQCSSEQLCNLFDSCLCIEPAIEEIGNEESDIDAIYQMYGYPRSKNKFSRLEITIPSAYRITLGRQKDRPAGTKLSIEFPLMCFELDVQNMCDDSFEKTLQLGRFEGMSGGPVIRHRISQHDSDGQLVGMLVEWHSKEKTAVIIPIAVIAALFSSHLS